MAQTLKHEASYVLGVTNRSAESEHRGYNEGLIINDGEVVINSEIPGYQRSGIYADLTKST